MTPRTKEIGLHVGTFVSGIVAAVSVMASSGVDLYAAYSHAYAGVKELMAAWAIIVPALTVGYVAYKSATKPRLQEALAAPDAVQAAREIPATAKVVAVANALKSDGH